LLLALTGQRAVVKISKLAAKKKIVENMLNLAIKNKKQNLVTNQNKNLKKKATPRGGPLYSPL
jgi:hypothetical protein